MEISRADWSEYVRKLSAIDSKAASLMEEYIASHGYDDPDALVRYAHALATKYGEASGALACEMYDEVAAAQGASVPPAVPADTATYGETAKAVRGTMKTAPASVPATTGRLVKQVGADTILKNAERDGAQFAWVPSGDTCVFCITLASNGWQYMSKNALKGGHAEHIHANCDCTYAVRFDESSGVKGYDPKKYKEMYDNAEGSNPNEKINSMRREQYAENKDRINAQKRMRYAERRTADRMPNELKKSLKSPNYSGKLGIGKTEDYAGAIREELGNIPVENVNMAVDYFLDAIRDLPVEHAIVIESSGSIVHFTGDEKAVNIFDVNLDGAHVVHNHPASNGIVSFGADDFQFIRENQNAIYELSNSEYNYKLTVLKPIDDLTYNEAYRKSLDRIYLEPSEDSQHLVMQWLNDSGYCDYVRERK